MDYTKNKNMEKEKKTLWVRLKKEIVNNYFNLTLYYLAVYGVVMAVFVYGVHYLGTGTLDYGSVKLDLIVVSSTLMFTMATMVKKLKDDIVSNYWKLSKMNQRKTRRKS